MNIQQKQEFDVAQSNIFQLECAENVFETKLVLLTTSDERLMTVVNILTIIVGAKLMPNSADQWKLYTLQLNSFTCLKCKYIQIPKFKAFK